MLALVAAPQSSAKLELRDVDEPTPLSNEVLVEVRALSLNRGELHRTLAAEDGWRPGWDIAGTVIQPAADGSGPAEGARVVGATTAGWAQRATMPTQRLAEMPEGLSFELASSLPVAGLTALRTLRVGGLLLGKHVLVTGAAGGVGRFAVQLAHRAGARVTAVVGNPEREKGLRQLGADEIVHEIGEGPQIYDLILESVGGPSLAHALHRVALDGTIVSFGNSSRSETTFSVNPFYANGARLQGFLLLLPSQPPFGSDLRYLAELVVRGELESQIGYEGSWRDAPTAMQALGERKVLGKAVLRVD